METTQMFINWQMVNKMWHTHTRDYYLIKTRNKGDFSGGPVAKNLPSNAGDKGLIPGQGTKIPCAVGQLSPRATTKDPACCN